MRKIRILWTDDEIEALKPHIFFLEEKGYEIDTCSNGNDTIDLVRQNIYLSLIHIYPDYLALQTKSQNLGALVSQLTIIQTEDSLQNVARMGEQERNALIASIIAKIVKDESEGKISERCV